MFTKSSLFRLGGRHASLRGALSALIISLPGVLPVSGDEKLHVAASFSVLAEWVEQVGGEHVVVFPVIANGGDLHHFDPVPADMRRLSRADVVYEIGLGLEYPWLDRMVKATGGDLRRIRLSDGLRRIEAPHDHDHGHDHHSHMAGAWDPHIWMDPQRASYMIIAIGETLAELDPGNAEAYLENAGNYNLELGRTKGQITRLLRRLPDSRRTLVLQHNNMAYFAEQFGLEILQTVQHGVDSEYFDPSALAIRNLVNHIREVGIPAVFTDFGENPAIMEQIAREAGVAVAGPLYAARFHEDPERGPTRYTEMLLHNAQTIFDALAQNP